MVEKQADVTGIGVSDTTALHEAARLMGQVRTHAKAVAARENGKRGGRPIGIPVTAETRRKISEAMRQRSITRAVQPVPKNP